MAFLLADALGNWALRQYLLGTESKKTLEEQTGGCVEAFVLLVHVTFAANHAAVTRDLPGTTKQASSQRHVGTVTCATWASEAQAFVSPSHVTAAKFRALVVRKIKSGKLKRHRRWKRPLVGKRMMYKFRHKIHGLCAYKAGC